MIIETDDTYREYKDAMEKIIAKGTALGDMELLSQADKNEFIYLTDAIYEWESAHHPLPGKISSLITDEIKKRMEDKKIKQKEAARMLGISESRISELLNGKRGLTLNIAKRLRDCFGIPADFILDNL